MLIGGNKMLKKRILMLCLGVSITLMAPNLLRGSNVYASEVNKSALKLQDYNLMKIKNTINKELSSKYEIMKTWKFTDSADVIQDPSLLKLINKKNAFMVKWYEKFNLKIDNYTSTVQLKTITQTSDNTYVTDAVYNVSFKIHNSNSESKAIDNERIELTLKNNNWYIIKLLNLDDYNENSNIAKTNNTVIKDNNATNLTSFSNYNNEINSEINDVDSMSSNIDEYYKEAKAFTEVSKDNEPIVKLDSYSGYNSTQYLLHKGIHLSIRNNHRLLDTFFCIVVSIHMENQEYKLFHQFYC